MRTRHTAQQGYSLVETLVAISILLIALVGPITISAKSLQSAYYAQEQVSAQFLAQEGIELIKAIRNDAYIEAIAAGDLSGAWDWTTDTRLSSCFAGSGCNIVLSSIVAGSPLITIADIQSCSSVANCRLHFDDANQRARFSLDSGDAESPYTRVITLEDDATGKGVIITSTVSWDSHLFKQQQSVQLTGAVYRIYE